MRRRKSFALAPKQPDLNFRAYQGGNATSLAYFGGAHAIVDMLAAAGADPGLVMTTLPLYATGVCICVPVNWGFTEKVRERLAQDPC